MLICPVGIRAGAAVKSCERTPLIMEPDNLDWNFR